MPKTCSLQPSALLHHPGITALLASRRASTQSNVDAAITAIRAAALANVEQLQQIASLDPETHLRELPSMVRSAERLLEAAEVLPRGGPTVAVDARSVTVNMGGRDPNLAHYTIEQLDLLLVELEAREASSEAVDPNSLVLVSESGDSHLIYRQRRNPAR